MVQFAGRCEALIRVPTGGAAMSVSTGALSSAQTVTLGAGSYYLTSAGGVSSLLTSLTTALNNAVKGAPDNAASVGAAIGGGTWSGGWLFQDASGNAAAAFGGVNLTAVSTPTYQNTGTGQGADLAVGFDSALDAFSAGDTYDVNGTSDLCVAWVGKWSAAANRDIVGKLSGSTGWRISAETTSMRFWVGDGVDAQVSDVATIPTGEWYVGIAALDRATNTMRFGIRTLAGVTTLGSSTSITLVGDTGNVASMTVGSHAAVYANGSDQMISALYIGTGTGCASGLPANLSTALTSFANAIISFFAASFSTTDGRATIANSFWPSSVAFTSTALRDVLGFEYDFDAPQTAAQVAIATGGLGTWTAGYLCNESSGSLAAVFGTPASLTAVSTPTYSNLGARGGTDKAVGFDSALDSFSGADSFDFGASDDFCIAWIGKWSAIGTNRDLFSKQAAALDGWRISMETTAMRFLIADGADAAVSDPAGMPTPNTWYVAIAAVDRAAATLRFGYQLLPSGTQVLGSSNSIAAVGAVSNAANFLMGSNAVTYTNGSDHFVSALYVGTGVGCAAGLPAGMSAALLSFATYLQNQVGTEQARGLWFPDSPLSCDDHPSMAPDETDVRMSESPTGVVLGLSGNVKYVHTNVTWQRCPVSQIREAEATYANGSLETFFRDAVSGLGAHEWMGPASPMQIWWNSAGVDTLLGEDANAGTGTAGWTLVGVRNFRDVAKMSQPGWTGQWDVTFGRLVSEG